MTTQNSRDQWVKPLRQQAEERVSKPMSNVSNLSADAIERLVYDLEVHKEELEIQNEELRQVQVRLQSAVDRYSDLYDFAPVGYLTVDSEGTIKEANLTASTMLGRERSNIINVRLALFCDQASKSQLRDHLENVQVTKSGESCQLKFELPKGSLFHARLDSNLVNRDSENWRCRVVITDINQQKRAELALVEKDNYLRSLADALPVLIGYFDTEFRFRFSNRAHEVWFGKSSDAIMGQRVQDVIGEASAIEIEDYLADALDGRRVEFETLLNKHNKGPRHVEIMLVPDRGIDGRVRGIHVLCIDVTERKVVEKQNLRRRMFVERLVCLSAAERSVYELLIRGKSNKFISAELDIGLRTAERRRKQIFEKLEVSTVAELLQEIANIQGVGSA